MGRGRWRRWAVGRRLGWAAVDGQMEICKQGAEGSRPGSKLSCAQSLVRHTEQDLGLFPQGKFTQVPKRVISAAPSQRAHPALGACHR